MGFGFATVTPSATSVAQAGAAAVWTYPQRSLTDIQSLVSAIQNNNPGAVPSYADLTYVPDAYYSGQVSLTQVATFIDNAIRNYALANSIAGLISNNPYNLWNTNFVGSLAVNPYLTVTSLNMLMLSASMTANSAQFLLYYLAKSYYYNKWIETVTANAPSITFSANATISTSPLIAQNITIASGVTVTCGTTTCIFVAQNFNNQGTIVAYGAPGAAPVGGAGAGGTGGGGIVVIAITSALGTLNVSGGQGSDGTPSASGIGNTGSAGIFYVVTGMAVATGGAGGYANNAGASGHNGGGGGGGAEGGGPGGNATVNSFSSPNAMVTYILQGLSDWWLINVLAKTPSSTTPLAFMYGSGGGGGGEASGFVTGGGGGGGGGEIVAYGYNIVSGTINAAGGGGGGSGVTSGDVYGGGGGGGGGLAFIFYGATSGSITASVAGGAGGTGYTGSGAGYNGAAGANGTAYIAAVTVNG